jgi:hypothetical protein
VGSTRSKNPLSILEVLCAKANDVEIASKVSEASDQFGKLGRERNSRREPTKVAANLCVKASTFPLDHLTETGSETYSKVSSSKLSNASCTLESSTLESTSEDNPGAMTPDEFMEMAKGLVTAPSGGNSVTPSPPSVVTASRPYSSSSCDMSTTSDITDWDFGSCSRGGSSGSSTFDADRVVENVYKLAAADPVLARRIAMAASITKIVEDGYQQSSTDMGLVARMLPPVVQPTKLSPVHERPKQPRKVRKSTVRMNDLPPLQPFMSTPSRASTVVPPPFDTQKTLLKKKRTKARREPSSKKKQDEVEVRLRRDPSGTFQTDSNSNQFCFVQDNPRSHM